MHTCRYCGSSYDRPRDVKSYRKDYGYCSTECIEADKSPCPQCGGPVRKYPAERLAHFVKRTFCSQKCAAIYHGSQKKSAATKARMAKYGANKTPEHLAKVRSGLARFHESPRGQEHSMVLSRKTLQWRAQHPAAVLAMVEKQHRTRLERGVYAQRSAAMKAFYETSEGVAQKERFRALYRGKKRPPRVTQQMRAGLRAYWDGPEGMRAREAISAQRCHDLPDAPYGPGWVQQRAKIRRRDGACVICGIDARANGRKLDVHHIYGRRRFGYIPGANRNYRWANHPANLVTLCQSCHIKVETGAVALPERYQNAADHIWAEFTTWQRDKAQSSTAPSPAHRGAGA